MGFFPDDHEPTPFVFVQPERPSLAVTFPGPSDCDHNFLAHDHDEPTRNHCELILGLGELARDHCAEVVCNCNCLSTVTRKLALDDIAESGEADDN